MVNFRFYSRRLGSINESEKKKIAKAMDYTIMEKKKKMERLSRYTRPLLRKLFMCEEEAYSVLKNMKCIMQYNPQQVVQCHLQQID